jgi:pSer/pThr/pTyr-binding forkhead associated (FHA) protein
MKDTRQILLDLEHFLTETIRANPILSPDDLKPHLLVRQILDELSLKRFIWVGNQTYVPNRLVVTVPNTTPAKHEELEVLFNSVVFTKFIYDYVASSGFKLLEALTIEIRPVTGGEHHLCQLSFEWTPHGEAAESVSVTVDETEGRILEIHGLKPQIPRLGRLTALSGEVYRSPYILTKRTTFLGRLRTVIDRRTGEVVRRNDFVYSRLDDDDSPNKSVSRQHASIVFDNGDFFLFDTGSANGTAVERAGEGIETPSGDSLGIKLDDGDIIRLGTALIRFELDPNASELTIAPPNPSAQTAVDDTGSGSMTVRVPRSIIAQETSKVLDSE